MNFKKMKNLFLRQSYLDSWTDYESSLTKPSFIKWDYLGLTICVLFKFGIFYVISSNVQCPVLKNTFIVFIINFIAF